MRLPRLKADELVAVHEERHTMSMAQLSTSRQWRFAAGESRDGRHPADRAKAAVICPRREGRPGLGSAEELHSCSVLDLETGRRRRPRAGLRGEDDRVE